MKIPGFTPGNSKSSPNGSTQNEKKQPQLKNTEISKENKQHDLDKKSSTASIPPSLSNPKELEKKSIKSEVVFFFILLPKFFFSNNFKTFKLKTKAIGQLVNRLLEQSLSLFYK